MKILIVSDTHGSLAELREVLKREKPVDLLVHCGDVEGQEREIEEEAGCPAVIVRGNNDYFTDLPNDREILIGDIPVFVSHGHRYGVSLGHERFRDEAKDRGCRIGMYGHTHRPVVDDSDPSCTVLNPGSLAYPRQANRLPSYIVMTVDESDHVSYEIKYLKRKKERKYSRLW